MSQVNSVARQDSGSEVESYLLNKSAKKKDWHSVNSICEQNSDILNESEISMWIRSKFMLTDFIGCYELCESIIPKKRGLLKEKCRFKLRSAVKLGDRDLISESIEYYRKIFPDNIDYKIEEIKILYVDGDYAECIDISNQILEKEPTNIIARKYNARAQTKLDINISEVGKSWESLLHIDPSNLEAINNIARVNIKLGQLDEASDQIDKLLQLSPSYVPGLSTLAQLKQASLKTGFQSEVISKSNYRTLYSERKYTEMIESLGGINASSEWSEDEATFVFRALTRLARFNESVNLFTKNKDMFDRFPRILVEVANSAYEINDDDTRNFILTKLLDMGKKDINTAKLFLQYLINSEIDENQISPVIGELMDIHGNNSLEFIISLILQSKRFEFFSSLDVFEGGATSLLDPIHGSLRNIIGDSGLKSIISENPDTFVQALESDNSRYSPSQATFVKSCIDLELPYLVSEIAENYPEIIKVAKLRLSELSQDEIMKYCENIKGHSLDFSELKLDPDSIVLCSNSSDSENNLSLKNIAISKISIAEDSTNLTGINKIFRGKKIHESISKIILDPRIVLGRFFYLLEDLKTADKMAISWIASNLFSQSPKEIWYDFTLPHGKIAATILGFPEEKIKLIDF